MADTKTSIIISAEDKTAAAFASARNGLQGLEAAASRLPVLGAALATAFSGAAFTGAIGDAIKFTASLDDMAEKTGASVETLSGLARVAQIGGHEIGLVEQATIKLAKGLAEADNESSGAARALKALGLSAAELRGMDTGQALKVVADRLNQFQDSGGKATLAMDLLSKSGAQALPFLKDLAEQGDLVVTTTTEQAAAAERYEKNMGRLAEAFRGTSRAIAADLMPMLESLSSRMEQAFSGGFIDGFTSRWAAAFKGMGAGINEALATTEEFLAKITFGRVAENHYKQALQYREAAKKIYSDLAALARNESAPAAAPTKSLAGYVSTDEKEPKGSKQKRGKTDLERFLDLGQKNELEAYYATGGEETMREVAATRALAAARDYNRELERMIELGQKNELEAYYETAGEETMRLVAHTRELKDAGRDTFEELTRAVDGFGKDAAGAIVDFALTGKLSFSDMVRSMIADLARMVVYKNVTGPIATGIAGLFKPNADGGVYSSPSLAAYSGGVYDSPRLFAFANGMGIFGEAGPEAIMPLKRGSDGKLGVQASSGGGVVVNVIEAPGKGGQVNQRSEGGRSIVDVMVEQIKSSIAGDIATGNGAVPAALQQTFGLNRVAGTF